MVVTDEGIPTLKKRAFEMPGHRHVMNEEARDFFLEAAQKQKDLNAKKNPPKV